MPADGSHAYDDRGDRKYADLATVPASAVESVQLRSH
jgi:hypothetical protein